MDDGSAGVDSDPRMETTTIPDPGVKPPRKVFVLVDMEDEFRQEEQDLEDVMEQDPSPVSGGTCASAGSHYLPPNQLAADVRSSEDPSSQAASLSIYSR